MNGNNENEQQCALTPLLLIWYSSTVFVQSIGNGTRVARSSATCSSAMTGFYSPFLSLPLPPSFSLSLARRVPAVKPFLAVENDIFKINYRL